MSQVVQCSPVTLADWFERWCVSYPAAPLEFSRLEEPRHELVPHGANPKAGTAGEVERAECGAPTTPADDFNAKAQSTQRREGELVRRCLWCVQSIRMPSYYVGGTWQTVISPARFFGADAQFTDGICPECAVLEQRKVKVCA